MCNAQCTPFSATSLHTLHRNYRSVYTPHRNDKRRLADSLLLKCCSLSQKVGCECSKQPSPWPPQFTPQERSPPAPYHVDPRTHHKFYTGVPLPHTRRRRLHRSRRRNYRTTPARIHRTFRAPCRKCLGGDKPWMGRITSGLSQIFPLLSSVI